MVTKDNEQIKVVFTINIANTFSGSTLRRRFTFNSFIIVGLIIEINNEIKTIKK